MKRDIYIIALFFLLLSIACGKEEGKGQVQGRTEISGVEVAQVTKRDVEAFYETSGTVKADTVSVVSSKVMGTVRSILILLGDHVKKGQVLITIDDSDISKKVQAAEAAHREAISGLAIAKENHALTNTTYERFRRLFEEKALTQQEMDEIEAKKRISESQLMQAEAMAARTEAGVQEAKAFLSYTRIASPINGVVSEKKIDVGSMASPGMPLVVIEDPSAYVVRVDVDERLFPVIRKGSDVAVIIESLQVETTGKVSEIGQAIDPVSRTFEAKITLAGKGLRSGFFASVRIPQGTTTAILVPVDAVVKRGQLSGVYTVNPEKIALYRLVKTGREVDGMVEILSGLDGTERVITKGAANAVDGGIVAGL